MALDKLTKVTTSGITSTVSYDLDDINSTGIITASAFVGDGSEVTGVVAPALEETGSYTIQELNAVGVVTASTFVGDGSGLTGVTASGVGIEIKDSGSIVGVAGTIDFGTNLNVSPAAAGIVTVTVGDSDFAINDKIVHQGDTDTAIRFPAADTFTIETAGSERVRVDSSGNFGIGTNNPTGKLEIAGNGSVQTINYGDGTTTGYFLSRTNVDRPNADQAIHVNQFRWNGTSVATIKALTGDDTVNKDNGYLTFETNSGGSLDERMRIDSNGNVGIGSDNPTATLDVNGTLNVTDVSTFQADVTITDNDKLRFGTSGGGILQVFTNGTNSFFKQTSGDLKYELADQFIVQKDSGDEPIAVFSADGSVELYYDNSKKFETTATGIDVTGHTETDTLNVSGVSTFNNNVNLLDNDNLYLGTDQDLRIYHSGSNAIIRNNTGGLFIDNDVDNGDITIRTDDGSGGTTEYIQCDGSRGTVELYHYGTQKFETTAIGIDVTGHTETDTLNVSGVSTFQNNIHLLDDDRLQIGGSVGTVDGLEIYHDGSNSYIADTGTGAMQVSASAIIVRSNVGENMAQVYSNGAVNLFYNNSQKFETTDTGVEVSNGASTSATIAGPDEIIIDPATVGDNTGAVRIKGDLFVDGTQTQINSTTLELADFIVGIATTATTDTLADGAGIQIGPDNTFLYEYNSGTNPSLKSSENLNVATGKHYQIGETEVLNATTLGSGVTNSSLTSVGTLTGLTVSGDVIASSTLTVGDASGITGGAPTDEGVLAVYTSGGKNGLIIQTSDNSQDRGIAFRNAADAYIGYISIEDVGSNLGDMVFGVSDATDSDVNNVDERVRFTKDGNVGIGTNDPVHRLDVDLDTGASVVGRFHNSGSTSAFMTVEASGTTLNAVRFGATGDQMSLWTGSSESVRIDSSGYVGINENDPDAHLHVVGNSIFLNSSGNAVVNIVSTQNATDSGNKIAFFGANRFDADEEMAYIKPLLVNNGGGSGNIQNGHLTFGTSGSERLRINSSGNVGIGSDNPAQKLDIIGDVAIRDVTPTLYLDETDTNTTARLIVSSGDLYVQAGASGSGPATSSGDIRFTGYNATDLNAFQVRTGGSYQDIWHAGNDGTGSGLDADTLDGQEGSYYLNTATSFGGDVSGTYDAIVIANDSHTHTFDNLTLKTSGTGDYSTTGDLVSGRGSGGVALTINDGYGNANVTFNHQGGTPEQNGKAGRIEVNTDSTSGDANMSFELGSASSGVAAAINQILKLSSGTSTWSNNAGLTFDNIPAFNGGTSGSTAPFSVDSTQVVTNLNADTVDGIEASSFLRSDAADTASGQITFTDSIVPSVGNDTTSGINWPANPGGGAGDQASIRYYVTSGENTTLEIRNNNDASDIINLVAGSVNVDGDFFIADKIVHTGDIDTAIRFPANDTVTVETNGIEKIRIESSGNIGIGTNNPAQLVDIFEDGATDTVVQIRSGTANRDKAKITKVNRTTGNGDLQIQSSSGSNAHSIVFITNNSGEERMHIDGAGNVGIGTDNPVETLSVAGDVRVQNPSNASEYLTINHQGINFQNTGVGSSTTSSAHLLDDYEEGSWTPEIFDILGSSASATYDEQTGTYTKIGNVVTVTGVIDLASASGSGSAIGVRGLPFLSGSNVARSSGPIGDAKSFQGEFPTHVLTSNGGASNHLQLRSNDRTVASSNTDASNLTNSSSFDFAITYFID